MRRSKRRAVVADDAAFITPNWQGLVAQVPEGTMMKDFIRTTFLYGEASPAPKTQRKRNDVGILLS